MWRERPLQSPKKNEVGGLIGPLGTTQWLRQAEWRSLITALFPVSVAFPASLRLACIKQCLLRHEIEAPRWSPKGSVHTPDFASPVKLTFSQLPCLEA